ncbi:MAG: hypothetical protein IPK52_11270 [Chloroflexi bacterium]|nr:hypothetical protein [Chloroflexota bacterium]
MPKAIFYNVPAHGHINPSLPLVRELVARGHTVIYYATEQYRAVIEAAGAQFRAYTGISDDYFKRFGLHPGVFWRVAYYLITTTGEMLPALLDAARAEAPDYVLYDGMCTWGYFVARVLGVPAITSLSLLPMSAPPARDMLALLPLLSAMTINPGLGIQAGRRSKSLARQYGVKSLGILGITNAYGDLCISYTSRGFMSWTIRDADKVRFVGRVPDEQPADSFSFEHVRDRPLIYVSFGTVNNDDTDAFKACIEAFGGGNYYVILSTGGGVALEALGPLPDNVAVYPWVPQTAVLKRAALFVTRCGVNSTHDALCFGVPMLLLPQQGDQIFVSMILEKLGAGLSLSKKQVNAPALRVAAAKLLAYPAYRARAAQVGMTIREAGGASKAANEIEAFLSGATRGG